MFKAGISTKDLTSLFLKCIEGHTSSKELNLPNLGCSIFMMVCWKERFCGRVKSQNGLGSVNLGVRRRRRTNVKGENVEKDSLLPWLCSCRYGWPVVQICALYRSLWPHHGGQEEEICWLWLTSMMHRSELLEQRASDWVVCCGHKRG